MYAVYIENQGAEVFIHHFLPQNTLPKLLSGKVVKEINTIPSFTFVILPNNPGFNRLCAYTTNVYVINDKTGTTEFEGRVLLPKPEMATDGTISKTVTCEGVLAYLCDSIQPYLAEKYWEGDDERTGLEEFIDYILEVHNSQTEDHKHIYRGDVNVHPFETSDNVSKGLNYQTTYECIMDKLVGSFGGEFDVRRADDGKLYLDYVEQFGEEKNTSVDMGVNMQSMSKEPNPTELATRLIPLGAKIEQEGEETEERLTIAEVNDGCIYLENTLAVEEFGIIYGIVEFDDVTTAAELKKKGEAYMQESGIPQKNTISALDLSLKNKNYQEFKLYNTYGICNQYLNEDSRARVIRQEIDVCDPSASTLTFGDKQESLIDYHINKNKEYSNIAERVEKTESDLKINEGAIEELRDDMDSVIINLREEVGSDMQQTSESIKSLIYDNVYLKDEVESLVSSISTEVEQTKDSWQVTFNKFEQDLNDLANGNDAAFEEIRKYIRFEDGNIILGNSESPLVLKIQNDRIQFLQNGYEVAYISDRKMYNTACEIIDRLIIGDSAWVVEYNTEGDTVVSLVGA